MKVETKFSIGDRVEIVELDRAKSVVTEIRIAPNGTTFKVHWFHNGERKEGWLFEHELKPADRF